MATLADGAPTGDQYEIKSGDTLWDIAKRVYGDPMKWQEIAAANGIENPNKIRPGQVIRLPGNETPLPRPKPGQKAENVPLPRKKPLTLAEIRKAANAEGSGQYARALAERTRMPEKPVYQPTPAPEGAVASTGAKRPVSPPGSEGITPEMLAEGPTNEAMAEADAMGYEEWMQNFMLGGDRAVPARPAPDILPGMDERFAERQRRQAINMEMIANGGVLKPRPNPLRQQPTQAPAISLLRAILGK